MYGEINFNKIKQGFISRMSDLVIMKACEVMNSWNDNEQWEIIMSHVTSERAGKGASAVW